jgi:Tfp pilus assembly protein PilN
MNNYLKKDLNLFSAAGRERGIGAIDFEKSLKKCLVVFVAIFAVVALVMLGINGIKSSKVAKLQADIDALQDDLNAIDEYKSESEQLQADIDRFNEAISGFETTSRLTTEDIKNVARSMPSGLTLTSFSYSGNSISLSVNGSSELIVADFANSLRNSTTIDKTATNEADYSKKNFKEVTYSGVSGSNGAYSGSITVTLNDIVIEEPEEAAPEATEDVTEAN